MLWRTTTGFRDERDDKHAMPPGESAKRRQRSSHAELCPTHMPGQRPVGRRARHAGSRLRGLLAPVKARAADDGFDAGFRELAAKLGDDRVRVLTPDHPVGLVKRQRTPPAALHPTRVPTLRRAGRRAWHVGSKLLELLELISPF